MSELKHNCCATYGSWGQYSCYKGAKFERDGKWFCGTHVPVVVKARREKNDAAWQIKYNAEKARTEEIWAKEAETQRRADLYPELLEAFKTTRAVLQSINDMGEKSPITDTLWMPSGHETLFDFIDAAIAKAEGKA